MLDGVLDSDTAFGTGWANSAPPSVRFALSRRGINRELCVKRCGDSVNSALNCGDCRLCRLFQLYEMSRLIEYYSHDG